MRTYPRRRLVIVLLAVMMVGALPACALIDSERAGADGNLSPIVAEQDAILQQSDSLSGDAILITGEADGAPNGCEPRDIADRLTALAEAINRGDPDLVDEFFGAENAPFEWYSIGPGSKELEATGPAHFVAYDLADLNDYFVERFEQNEHWSPRQIQFNGWEPERGIVHFGPFLIDQRADDLEAEFQGRQVVASGKGAFYCATQSFIVLSLAMTIEE